MNQDYDIIKVPMKTARVSGEVAQTRGIFIRVFKSLKVRVIMTDGQNRVNIKPGQTVSIVLKKDQKSGFLTQSTVKTILTKSSKYPHGIKV
jgi:uncharacterized repeat protein (TIGR03833 family)